jgi:hypothetical protein
MHNIYVTLSRLCSIDEPIILQDITIQNINKIEFLKKSIHMVTPISKHDITKEKYKRCTLKPNNKKELIMIKENSDNNIINDDVMDYWHEDFQLTINDGNILLNSYGWLNDQHMATTMQMLYVQTLESLRYQQHTYTIIGTIHRYLSKCVQHFFIN